MSERRTSSYIRNVGPLPAALVVDGEPMLLQPGEGFSITFIERDKLAEIKDVIEKHAP